MTTTTEDYERAALRLLKLLVRVSGWTQRRLDAHLGYSVGVVSRLLAGKTRLLYTHILDILAAVGVEPASFFDVLHPSTSPLQLLELVARVRRIGAGEDDPALLPVEERVQLSVERFRAEIGGVKIRGGAHGGSKLQGSPSPRRRRSSAAKRSS